MELGVIAVAVDDFAGFQAAAPVPAATNGFAAFSAAPAPAPAMSLFSPPMHTPAPATANGAFGFAPPMQARPATAPVDPFGDLVGGDALPGAALGDPLQPSNKSGGSGGAMAGAGGAGAAKAEAWAGKGLVDLDNLKKFNPPPKKEEHKPMQPNAKPTGSMAQPMMVPPGAAYGARPMGGAPQYGGGMAGMPQYGAPQYGGQPQYGAPQYGGGMGGVPQYGGQPQYGMGMGMGMAPMGGPARPPASGNPQWGAF
jgi:hypothetical protein